MSREVKWKRNFLRVPNDLKEAVANFKGDLFVVAQTKKIPVQDIASGVYAHIGLKFENGVVVTADPPVVPRAKSGKWSDRNRNGWERKRRDLPMITKTYSWETPNFGDASTYGTHVHYQDREVYQAEYYEARQYPVVAEVLQQPGAANVALVKFSVGTILSRKAPTLDYDFLLCVNLLQENAGVAGVFSSTATREEYIGTIALDWEIFPPGTTDAIITAVLKGKKVSEKMRGVIEARVRLFNSLKPTAIIRGHGGFSTYIGAQFADDLVVFENVNYGNALYVLYDNWMEVSKRSRIDLIKGTSEKFDRFVHTDGWEDRFEEHMKNEKAKRAKRR